MSNLEFECEYDMMIGRRAYYVSSRPYLDEGANSSNATVRDAELAKYYISLFFTLYTFFTLAVSSFLSNNSICVIIKSFKNSLLLL